jgi:hypothetical protein
MAILASFSAAAGAKDVPQLALGDLRIGGRGGDHQYAVVCIDLGGRDRHAGIEVADHEAHAVADKLVRDRNALFRIGDVVSLLDHDPLPENSAAPVEILRGLSDALRQLRAERGVRAGDRTRYANRDVRLGRAREAEEEKRRHALEKR